MASSSQNTELTWRPAFDGREQYALVPFPAGSALEGMSLILMVLCDRTPFTEADQEHALRRVADLERHLQATLARMARHLGLAGTAVLLERYDLPTIMLNAGNWITWSFSLEPRIDGIGYGVFCDFVDDTPGAIWVAE